MVVVDPEVAVTADGEIEEAVFGERLEHVVEEADSRPDGAVAVAVEIDRHLDLRLGRLAAPGRRSIGHTLTCSRSHISHWHRFGGLRSPAPRRG